MVNKFIIYNIKILFLSIGLAFFLQIMADIGLKKSDLRILNHWEDILEGRINSDLIILGSSRGVVSYDPHIFHSLTGFSSFNLSFDAGSFNLQSLKFDAYLNKNSYPKIIVQNVDISHFSKSILIPNKYQFIPFWNTDDLIDNLSAVEDGFGKFSYIPLIKYNKYENLLIKGLINAIKVADSKTTSQGYSPVFKTFRRDDHNILRLQLIEKNDDELEKYYEGLRALEEKLQNDIPSGTTVFLVWAPEQIERLQYAVHIRKEIEQFLKYLETKFPNVYFFNYSSDPISSDRDLFYDTFHLNDKGAKLFSEKVSWAIKGILN